MRGEHLVLSHIRSNECVATRQAVQGFDDFLWFDQLAVAVVFQTIDFTPLVDLFPPFFDARSRTTVGRDGIHLRQLREHIAQNIFDITDNRYIGTHAFGNRRRIDINVNNFARHL